MNLIQLDENEAKEVIRLLDIATRLGGLEIAQSALPLALRVNSLLEATDAEPEISEVEIE